LKEERPLASARDLRGAGPALALLCAINTLNFFDRQVMVAVAEPIRREWALGDGAVGALGTAFTLLYAVGGIPFGRLADRARRTRILAAGVFAWSALTVLQGLARTFSQLFVLRLLVGVGEATCAPAAVSLIGDLVPPAKRSRALAAFMLGLPLGLGLSYAVSGWVAQGWGWRSAFFVAGPPGILCAALALRLREPARAPRPVAYRGTDVTSPYRQLLAIPTLWWIIASGAVHNFNMYALGTFLSPYLIRLHGLDVRRAGLVSMLAYGLAGIPGMLLGGVGGDALRRRGPAPRLHLGAGLFLCAAPLIFVALRQPAGRVMAFGLLLGLACAAMAAYYSIVYAALQDVVPASLRGTAMAVYFLAMYVLGASFGPVATGLLSDRFTARAARAAGGLGGASAALEPFRAAGLHAALLVVPALGLVMAVILWAASRTVDRDALRVERGQA
jgi:predicted MFS family arabinose efflux permease